MSERVNGLKYMIYYDADVDGRLYPLWYIADGPINWNTSSLFLSIDEQAGHTDSIGLDDGVIGCAVHIGEMLLNKHRPDQFGVNLKALRARVNESVEPEKIHRLIFRISDIEDLLSINKEKFIWG